MARGVVVGAAAAAGVFVLIGAGKAARPRGKSGRTTVVIISSSPPRRSHPTLPIVTPLRKDILPSSPTLPYLPILLVLLLLPPPPLPILLSLSSKLLFLRTTSSYFFMFSFPSFLLLVWSFGIRDTLIFVLFFDQLLLFLPLCSSSFTGSTSIYII